MKLEISGSGLPGGTEIRLDGQDIVNAVRGVSLTMGVDQSPTLELDISHVEVTRLELEDVEVTLPTATRELLIDMGWTPPQDPAGSDVT